MRTLTVSVGALGLTALLAVVPAGALPQDTNVSSSGDAERGKEFFSDYKCYACHGHSGQTGTPRLVPMVRNEASFIGFLRSPSGGMPAYADVSEERLADVYAYIRSIEPDALQVEDIPLLNELIEEIQQAR